MDLRQPHIVRARQHAIRRVWERFGLAMNEAELRQIEEKLVAGKFLWVSDLVGGAVAYEASIRGRTTYPVFNIGLWAIVTFLPSRTWARQRAIRSK